MTPADILAHITAAGILLEVAGDKILAQPADRLTDEHRGLIRANKPTLMALLSEPRRLWDVVEPTGVCWRSSFCPHVTAAQVSTWYPGATVTPSKDQQERAA